MGVKKTHEFSKNTLIKQTIRITHEKVSMQINYNENVLLLEICKNYVQCTFLELLNLNFTLFIKVKCAKKNSKSIFLKMLPLFIQTCTIYTDLKKMYC